jgi:hypothetical protein
MKAEKIKGFIALLLIVIVLLITLMPKRRQRLEKFDIIGSVGLPSSEQIYQNATSPADFDGQIRNVFNALSDQNSLMIYKRCYAFPGMSMDDLTASFLNPIFYTRFIPIYANDFKQVRDAIIVTIQNFATNHPYKKIKGDVYVMVMQAPYINDRGQSISVSTDNVENYIYNPLNINNAVTNSQMIYYNVMVMFGSYKANGRMLRGCYDLVYNNLINTLDANNYSKEPQCFMSCIGDNSKFCGCATSNNNDIPAENFIAFILNFVRKYLAQLFRTTSYSSTCLGPRINGLPTDPKDLPTTYASIYIVNQTYDGVKNLFDSDTPCKLVKNSQNTY